METVENKLAEWLKQPGTVVTEAEWQFIAAMRKARAAGVGYGWMQQVCEWEWNATTGGHGWGPEFFAVECERLTAERDALRAAAEWALAKFTDPESLDRDPAAVKLKALCEAALAPTA